MKQNLRVSKSGFLAGIQCQKRLWTEKLEPQLLAPPTAAEQHRFDQGQTVGALAQTLYPDGLLLDDELNFDTHLEKSREALSLRRPLFEPAFSIEGAYSRADILTPSDDGAWDLVEVKSASNIWADSKRTKVDQVYLDDVSFQVFVYESAGLKISNCFLLFVDSQYVRVGEVDATRLFRRENITQAVRALLPTVGPKLATLQKALRADIPPAVAIGPHCESPYDCPVMLHCWSEVPKNSVHTLYYARGKQHELWNSGIRTLLDIPESFSLTERQSIQVNAEKTGSRHVDREAIDLFLRGLKFPLFFLDFETFQLAVPPYEGCRPYRQIPFQFSLHVLETPESEPEHHEFLANDSSDPRPSLLSALAGVLRESGSIVSYNAGFEKTRIKELGEAFPQYQDWCVKVSARFEDADLLKPFREFSFYDPRQFGSASIKSVLPALTDIDYSDLSIAEGGTAAAEFLRMASGKLSNSEALSIRRELLRYCQRDTLAMVEVYRNLRLL